MRSTRLNQAWRVALVSVLLVAGVSAADAQTTLTDSVSATFTVGSTSRLTLSASTLTFLNSDPDTVPQIPPSEGPLVVTVSGRSVSGSSMLLTVQASDDFRSGMDVIPVANLTWIASGTGFLSGTMNRTTAATAGFWASSGSFAGTLNYRLLNSWSYATGNYRVTITYTLTAP